MIQQMFNMMWAAFMSKIMLNDIPHMLDGPGSNEEPYWRRISLGCANIAFIVNLVYDRGVALEYDLTLDRLEDAKRRLADLEDMIPQVYGLTNLTTPGEREDLVKALGRVRGYMDKGDTLMAQGAADEFNASFRNTMWNIIVRCEGL